MQGLLAPWHRHWSRHRLPRGRLAHLGPAVVAGLIACGGPANVTPTPSSTPEPTPPQTAMTYYVSPSGNDAWPGTLAQPFATIRAAAGRLFPGDALYVRAGSYHETEGVWVSRSGTADAPITIAAYPGDCPTLVGATPVAGPWVPYSSAIYQAAWLAQPSQVFADGHLLNEARWPNTAVEDFVGITSAQADAGSSTSITHAGLPSVDLTDAWVHIKSGESWVAFSRRVSSHDRAAGRLSWVTPVDTLPLVPCRGNHFYVFGKLELLDAPGEWWWDPVEHALYVWMPDGASPAGRVEAGSASPVLTLNGVSYITVRGLSARGGWFNLQNSHHCTIQDCHLWAPNWSRTTDGYSTWPPLGGVDISGDNNLVLGGSVRLAGRSGIRVNGDLNTVRQVTIENSGWNGAVDCGIYLSGGEETVIENCTLRRTSGGGLYLAPRSRASNNLVENACLFTEDCGNIAAWSMDGAGTEVTGNVIRGNRARWGAGIYLDYGSHGFNLHDNLIEHILWGGLNITGVNTIENNTILDFQHQGIAFVPLPGHAGDDWSAGRVAHNQITEPFPLNVRLAQPVLLVPDYASYAADTTLAPQPGPRRVELRWSDFAQPGWSAQPVPMNLSQVDAIDFVIDTTGATFSYTVSNLRLIPFGGTGDVGAVPVTGTSWTAECQSPSSCSIAAVDAVTWRLSGSHVYGGSNRLSAPLPAGLTNLTPYRGLAFDLGGTASRRYDHQGYQDTDNGPEAVPGRGAHLPDSPGADPSGAWPTCASTPPQSH